MKREEVISELGKPILRPLAWLVLFGIIAFVSTPFVWMWDSWYLAWRVGLTGFISFWVFGLSHKFVESVITEGVNQEIDRMDKGEPVTSKFKQRLEEAQKAKRNKRDY